MSNFDYYAILGLDKKCSDSEIKKSYRKLAIQYHPDKQTNKSDKEKKEAEEKFKQVSEAYEILSDPEKRKKYDAFGKNAFTNDSNFQGFHSASDIFNSFFSNGMGNFDDDFFARFDGHSNRSNRSGNSNRDNYGNRGYPGGIKINFGGNRDGKQRGGKSGSATFSNFPGFANFNDFDEFNNHSQQKKVKRDPTYIDISISLADLYTGKTKTFKINRNIYFPNGEIKNESENIVVEIKPGWKEGTKITFANKGDIYPNEESADIIFVIKQKPDEDFTRDDNNLIVTLDLPLVDALNGFNKIIKDIEDNDLNIIERNGIPTSNYIHIIKNKGMPIRKSGQVVGKGDLLVKFNVIFK